MTNYSSHLDAEHKARVARLWAPPRQLLAAPEPIQPDVIVRRRSRYPQHAHNSEILSLTELRVSLHEILAAISAVTGVTLKELTGHGRAVPLWRARRIYYHLARTMTDKSLPQIAHHCGNRDHSTVIHGLRGDMSADAPAITAVKKMLGVGDG